MATEKGYKKIDTFGTQSKNTIFMKEFFRFLISKAFLKQLLYVTIFLGVCLFLTLWWLKSYTNHNQKIVLDDYLEKGFNEAKELAAEKTFELIVTDSIHIVGKAGGLIIDQNPGPNSEVKENRKVYVRTTKYSPDKLKVKDLPSLYGRDYDQVVVTLKQLYLNCKVKERKYDNGQPNHILEVYYDGTKIISTDTIKTNVEIEKGGTLEFVLSKNDGGSVEVPDFACKTVIDVKALLQYSRLNLGEITEAETIKDIEYGYVVNQSPSPNEKGRIPFGTPIDITISPRKPKNCE